MQHSRGALQRGAVASRLALQGGRGTGPAGRNAPASDLARGRHRSAAQNVKHTFHQLYDCDYSTSACLSFHSCKLS